MSTNDKKKYQKLDPISHIHHRPDMYVGSLKKRDQGAEYVFEDDKIVIREHASYSDGILRLFTEVISNVVDNCWRSKKEGVKVSKIRIDIDKSTGLTKIWNDGLHIPVERDEKEGIYIPEMIFGHLLAGSNMDDTEKRLSSGRNGLGIKLVNVFSKEFSIEVFDPIVGKVYTQKWTDHMRTAHPSKIKSKKGVNGYTMIEYIPDFEKFGYTGYDDLIMNIYTKIALDTSMITRIPVFFNDAKITFRTLKNYASMYGCKESEMIVLEKEDHGEVSLALITSSPDDEYHEVVFTNGIYNKKGGVHADALRDEFLKAVLQKINKKNSHTLTIKDIRKYFMIFLVSWIPNPEFDSQSKTRLLSPSMRFDISPKHVQSVTKWGIMSSIDDLCKWKDMSQLKKTEKKTKTFKKIEGLDHANLAGTKKAKDCTLILCEGLSAKTYASTGINVGVFGKKGRDYFGIYALRGKMLNVRNASTKSITENREISDIIQALGLRYQTDYSDEKNVEQLRYGRLLILTDADEDGSHICSLIINMFDTLFPSLLQPSRQFLWLMMTPIAKIFHQRQTYVYYDDRSYQKALEEHTGSKKNITVKYYKGLGTSSDAEIRDSFGQKVVHLRKDEDCEDVLIKIFHKAHADKRKEWLTTFDPTTYQTPDDVYSIRRFIDQELIRFSIEDCRRSIPNMFDGLKTSQRKILYSVFKKNLLPQSKSMKVAQLAGFCAECSNYHHGEQCLFSTIIKMTHEFPGSNNIALLERDGQFGSRAYGGADAASARYIYTKCKPLTRVLFPRDDDDLLSYTLDDGDKVEPDFYVPVLPIILGNGCTAGIGTGWSCSVPNYNFLDLVRCVHKWLDSPGHEESGIDNIIPWYHGFTGTIEKIGDHKFVTSGRMQKMAGKKDGIFEITELPIGTWTNRYKEELETMVENKQLRSMKNYSTPDSIHFVVEASDSFVPDISNMKLQTVIHSTNIVLFEENLHLKKFATIGDVFQMFCHKRLGLYRERRKVILSRLEMELLLQRNKKRFIEDVFHDRLRIFKVPEADIISKLSEKGFEKINDGYGYLLDIPIKEFTSERIQALERKILELEQKAEETRKTTASDMWKKDLKSFEDVYTKHYKA